MNNFGPYNTCESIRKKSIAEMSAEDARTDEAEDLLRQAIRRLVWLPEVVPIRTRLA